MKYGKPLHKGCTMRLIGYYNELEYHITDIDTNEDMHIAGNSRYDSRQYSTAENGIGIEAMKECCESAGKEIACENYCEFLGTELIEDD